ncbi:MAG: hypothetical protein LBF58_10910 [Deltaproteobacteria bacterium]|nr:hypothetical protein [Deltaproteobacteria bacterium]
MDINRPFLALWLALLRWSLGIWLLPVPLWWALLRRSLGKLTLDGVRLP